MDSTQVHTDHTKAPERYTTRHDTTHSDLLCIRASSVEVFDSAKKRENQKQSSCTGICRKVHQEVTGREVAYRSALFAFPNAFLTSKGMPSLSAFGAPKLR